MLDFGFEILDQYPACLSVLRAYAAENGSHQSQQQAEPMNADLPHATDTETAATNETAESRPNDERDQEAHETGSAITDDETESTGSRRARWIPRLRSLDGLSSEELSSAHGRLLAFGLLKCDLQDSESGVVYQLTLEGRQLLNRVSVSEQPVAA